MINRKRGNTEFSITYCLDTDANNTPSGTTDTEDVEKQPRTCPYCSTELERGLAEPYVEILHNPSKLTHGVAITMSIKKYRDEVWVCPECRRIIR